MSDAAPLQPRSDLGVRTMSGVVMLAVAGLAVWLGSWPFMIFVIAIGAGVIWEWWGLASKIAKTPLSAALWLAVGVSYVGFAMAVLVWARTQSVSMAINPILCVIVVDVGAYFAGRFIGGPKIAPSISPSKTWAGLLGGAVLLAALSVSYLYAVAFVFSNFSAAVSPTPFAAIFNSANITSALAGSALVAIIAQSGDFFESWMKRRAGVKDSGSLIPGHGGLFDRVDGLLAVLVVGGVTQWIGWGF